MEQNNDNRMTSIIKVENDSRQQYNGGNGYQPNWTRPNTNYSYHPVDYSKFGESGWDRFWRLLGIGFAAYLFHFLLACFF